MKKEDIAINEEKKVIPKAEGHELDRYYIAYGSNMDVCRMFKRCKDAQYYGTGWLEEHSLGFQKSKTGFYANARKAGKLNSVPVVVYRISASDEACLDKFEGFPENYKKKHVSVNLEGDITVQGIMYYLPRTREYGIPTIKYYRMIENAYKIFDLDMDFLREALRFTYYKAKERLNSENKVIKKNTCDEKKKTVSLVSFDMDNDGIFLSRPVKKEG